MDAVTINRAPVLTPWAAVVAERLGFDRDEALSLGKSVAGLAAPSKAQRLGIFILSPEAVRRQRAEKARVAGVKAADRAEVDSWIHRVGLSRGRATREAPT
jgi:hypothetical protein